MAMFALFTGDVTFSDICYLTLLTHGRLYSSVANLALIGNQIYSLYLPWLYIIRRTFPRRHRLFAF